MGKCYVKGTLTPGEKKFTRVLEDTGDFFRASNAAYKVLQDNGVDITRSELDAYLRDNYVGAFANDGTEIKAPFITDTLGDGPTEEKQAEIERKAKVTGDLMKSAVSKLNREQQVTKQMAIDLQKGEGDLNTALKQAKEAFGIKIDPSDMTDEQVGKAILRAIEDRYRPSFLSKALKVANDNWKRLLAWENFDLGSYLSVMDRRQSKTTDGGILETLIHDKVRLGTQQVSQDLDTLVIASANNIAKAYGETFGADIKQNDKKYFIKKREAAMNYLKQKGVESAARLDTGIVLADGTVWETSKGELMQLYIHVTNPDLLVSMEKRGVSLGQLEELVDQYLTAQDKEAAFSAIPLYREMYAKESRVFERMYGKPMPQMGIYTGQASFIGDVETEESMTANSFTDMRSISAKLGNSKQRSKGNALDLNVNFYSNLFGRSQNSARFTGGAEVYSEIYNGWNRHDVKQEVLKSNPASHHSAINNMLQQAFGLKSGGGALPNLINYVTRGVTMTSLAFKPKLMLNQMTSSLFWFEDKATFDGFTKSPEYTGVNISKLLYDNSPVLQQRYAGQNLTALESSLNAAGHELENITKAKGTASKGFELVEKAAMLPTMWGDSIGIMAFGRAYFMGEYKRLRAEGKSHEDAEAEAIYRFGKKLSKTQQSFEQIDRSELQKSNLKIFTMFQTTPRQFRRIVADSSRQLIRAATGKEYKGTVGKHMLKIAIFHSGSGMLYQFVMQTLPAIIMGEADEDDWEKLARSGIVGSYYNSFFIIGDIIQNVLNKIDGYNFGDEVGRTAAFQNIKKVYQEFSKLHKYANKSKLNSNERLAYDRAMWNSWAYLAQLVARIPVKSLGLVKDEDGRVSLIKNLEMYREAGNDLLDGKMDPETFLQLMGYGDWTIDQYKPKAVKPKKKKKSKRGSFNSNKSSKFDSKKKSPFNKKSSKFNKK